ncbi:MAG TPA: hypothetical protein ENL21_03770 [Caldithrix abyssi]|uniref:DUF5320 domain-containing protein n=1 Tax=Caldithrix abyssi TaxID=187145 RepID=A0A7V5H2Y8_CALAY|nr:hypothetical protein [Caldithrix abyssi]
MQGKRGHFHWNFFPGHFWGWRTGFGGMMGMPPFGWRWRPTKEEELEWLKEYQEELKSMREDLEEELKEVQQRISELEKED